MKPSCPSFIAALFTIALLALVPVPRAEAAPVVLDDSMNVKSLGLQVEYLVDPRGDLGIGEVSGTAHGWIRSTQEQPGFGFTRSVYWLRFSLKNESRTNRQWYLEVAYPMLDSIRLYEPRPGGGFTEREMGDRLPFAAREIPYRNPVFAVTVKKGDDAAFYLRVQSESSMNIPLQVWAPRAFNGHNVTEQIILGLYYGSMLIMLVYNFFLFIGIRYRSYLFYMMYIAGYILFQMTLNGIAFQYLWPDSIWWANVCLPFFMFFTNIWLQIFNRIFLNSKKLSPVFDRIYLVLLAVSALGAASSLVFSYAVSIRIATFVILVSVILMLVNSIMSMARGYRAARIYVIAWSAFIIGTAFFALKTFGILPNNFFTNWSIQIGSVIKVVLMSLALADQINILRQEKTSALTSLNEAYSRFVPHEFLELLEKESITDIKLGDQVQRDITILFSDIRSFTTLSESMTPQENFNFLNSYLKRISPVIRTNHGFIDKFIGDAIMALFPSDPLDAVRASVEVQKELIIYNQHRKKTGYQPISIGIGLHTGAVMLGTIGEHQRIDGTVIADAVNVASRIEGLTKSFRSPVLVSGVVSAVARGTGEYHCRRLGRVKMKGKTSAIDVCELLEGYTGPEYERYLAGAALFEEALEAFFTKQFADSAGLFSRVLSDNPTDRAAFIYHERAAKYAAEGVPPDWKFIKLSKNAENRDS